MTVHVWDNYFTDRELAIQEIEAAGLYLVEVDLTTVEPDRAPHAHDYDAHFYVLDGAIELHDLDAGTVYKQGVGSKVVMTRGTRHFGVHAGYRGLIGMTTDPKTLRRQ
jgi:hypothetical protein